MPSLLFASGTRLLRTLPSFGRVFNWFLHCKNMVLTNFNGAGVGFGFGVGCGFGVGWGFGGMPLNILGLGAGGGCGVGLGLGWGFGTAFGSQYRSSTVTFQGVEFHRNDESDNDRFKHLGRNTEEVRASQ